jgi:hypothetical protein
MDLGMFVIPSYCEEIRLTATRYWAIQSIVLLVTKVPQSILLLLTRTNQSILLQSTKATKSILLLLTRATQSIWLLLTKATQSILLVLTKATQNIYCFYGIHTGLSEKSIPETNPEPVHSNLHTNHCLSVYNYGIWCHRIWARPKAK